MSVEHWQEELEKRIGELKKSVNGLKDLEDSNIRKRKMLDASGRRLYEVQEARKNCDRAVRILKDTNKRVEGKAMLREADKEIRYYQDEMRRVELHLNYDHAVAIDDNASDQEYKKEIDRMQGGMRESYDRQIRTLDRTLDTAHKTREAMDIQGDQIKNISSEARRIGDNIEYADNAVRRLKKQVSSDKIFQGLMVANVLVLITWALIVGFKWDIVKQVF